MKAIALKLTLLFVLVLTTGISKAEPVWIDVRSAPEHFMDSIDGDRRISHDDIVEQVESLYPDRETDIRLYCRSGARAGKALAALEQKGYTNVSNAGGIDDARRERGLID